jgi:hypothetical protein
MYMLPRKSDQPVLKGLQTVARNSIRGRGGSAVAEFEIAADLAIHCLIP